MNNQEHRKSPRFRKVVAALTMPALRYARPSSPPRPFTTGQDQRGATNATLQAALQKLQFPGVAINVQERCVMWKVPSAFIEARWSCRLHKGTKEHESIVAIAAKPVHIHAALLLLGAKPGSPATRQQLGIKPSAGSTFHQRRPVDVFLVLKGKEGKMSSTHQRFHRPLQQEVR